MKKYILATAAVTLSLSIITAVPALAGTWLLGQDGSSARWWYDNGDGTRPVSEWVWIDGNNDGLAECYYFDNNGWLLTNTITPDNYSVDLNGAWTTDGIVQTRSTVLTPSQDIANPAIGWQWDGTDWKYFLYGSYLTSQWHKISGKWYYFNENSVMATGFQEIEGDYYYFTSSGALKTRNFSLNGFRYLVEDNGVISDYYALNEDDSDEWEAFQSESDKKSSSDKSKNTGSSPSGQASALSADDKTESSAVNDSPKKSSGSSNGGPSDESSDVSSDAYQKPDDFEYSYAEPDSDYRQSSADKYIISEEE